MNSTFLADMLFCQKCPLSETRTNVVVGSGNENANVVLVGESAGATENREGKPFVGRSGKVLRTTLQENDIDDEKDVYITNIIKCHPPENRDPTTEEISQCLPYLRRQIQTEIQPEFIVGVGRISSQRFKEQIKITRDHGTLYTIKDKYTFMPLYHPAYVMRNGKETEQEFIEDIQKIKQFIS